MPVTVNLQVPLATAVGGLVNLQNFVGSPNADTLIARNVDNTWDLTSASAGDIGGAGVLDFASFENLIGGAANDLFILSPGASVGGSLNGAAGVNTLDYHLWTVSVSVNLVAGTASGAGAIAGIGNVLGGSAGDTLIGDGNPNVLVGNGGDDDLEGGAGNDVLIGGNGKDTLLGQAGDDILIGGTTAFDASVPDLINIILRWNAATSLAPA